MLLLCAKYSRSLGRWEETTRNAVRDAIQRTSYPVWGNGQYHPISAKDLSRLQFGPKVLPGVFLGYVLYAGRSWKGDIIVADTEELQQMDASELHARRINAKAVLTPMKVEKFIFPIADGTVKISGGDQDLRTSALIRDSPDRERRTRYNLRGESEASSSTSRRDSSWFDGETKGDFWSISGGFIYRHHVEPQVKLYVSTEESFPTPLKYIDVMSEKILKRTGTLMEIVNYQIRGLVPEYSLF